MNKKKLDRVKSLYRDGVSMDVCLSSIMGMSTSHTDAAIFIRRFVRDMIEFPLYEEISNLNKLNDELHLELYYQTLTDKEKEKDEQTDGTESPNLGD